MVRNNPAYPKPERQALINLPEPRPFEADRINRRVIEVDLDEAIREHEEPSFRHFTARWWPM